MPLLGAALPAGARRSQLAHGGRAVQSGLSSSTDPEVPFSWSQEDVSDLYSHTTILLAAEGEASWSQRCPRPSSAEPSQPPGARRAHLRFPA